MVEPLGPNEVEALARHEVTSQDLRLGFAAQHAAEDMVEYKLSRLLAVSGAELKSVELVWVCQGRAIGVKRDGTPVIEHHQVRTLPPAPPSCVVCGAPASIVKTVPVPGYGDGFTRDEMRCDVHG